MCRASQVKVRWAAKSVRRSRELDHGMGFILFMEGGRIHTLEGFTYANSTTELDLEDLNFEVVRTPAGTHL